MAAFTKAVVEVFWAQLILLLVFGWMSSRNPYQSIWLRLCVATYALYLWPAVSWALAWNRRAFRIDSLAAQLDKANPGSPDVFRTLLSLENHPEPTLDALNRFYGGLENQLRVPKLPLAGAKRAGFLIASVSLALILPIFSHHYSDVLNRMLRPTSALENIPVPRLDPLDIPERAALGDTLRVGVRVTRLPASEPVYAHIRYRGREQRYPLLRNGDTAWFQHGPVEGDFELYFSALSTQSSEYAIQAVPSPYLRSLTVLSQPPTYTHNPAEALPEMPATLTALPGSRISWKASSSQPLEKLLVIFKEGDARFDTLNLGSGNNFTFQRSVRKSTEIRFRLFAAVDKLNGHAGPYRIEPGVDALPEIAFLTPSQDGELGRNFKVPVVFRAQDDYGISRVELNYAVMDGQNIKSKGSQNITAWLQASTGMGGGVWGLDSLSLQPGDVVEIYLQAFDNDAASGPKTARSQTLRLRLPSPEEILAQINVSERNASTSLKSAAERVERAQEAQRQADESNPDAPPQLGPWEIRAILNAAPQDHLQRLERHLQAEAERVKNSPADKPLAKQLESLRKDVQIIQKRLPPPEAFQKPIAEQRRLLDTLMKDQQALDQKLSGLKDLPPPEKNQPDALAQERKSLQDELKNNMKQQQDLKTWMKDQEQSLTARQKSLDQASQAQDRAREDVKKAAAEMQKSLQKGVENGALTPDLLEKMDRIQELLKEALSDSLREQMQRNAENQQFGAEDVERNLKDMLDRQENVREGLDRAIRMLEMLRDMRALESLARDLRQMQNEEQNLAEDISQGDKDAGELSARQAELGEQLEKDMQEMSRLASEQKAFQGLKNQKNANDAKKSMQQAEKSLKKKSPADKSQAGENAKDAAQSLSKAADGLDDMISQMQGGPESSEIADLLDETLEFTRWLDLIRNQNDRVREGWVEDDAALKQRAAQLTRWLTGRMIKLAASQPYESAALRREATAMASQADVLLTASFESPDSLLYHSRMAARELLKWLQNANEDDGGMAGSGSGSAKKKKNGKGKGQGEGEGDDEGLDGMAGRLRGVSGKQMAVNQSTYQLLRSFLEGRKQSGGSSGSSGLPMPGGGQPSAGQSGMPGGNQSSQIGNQPGSENGNQNGIPDGNGNGSQSGNQNGNAPGGAANSQQGIGESLERMAESASDAGGAARKLRQLAEEARNLERDLRQNRVDPEELRRRQERFQTRLLEAANSMEERGEDRQRQAQAYLGGALKTDSQPLPQREDIFRELEQRRAWSRGLPLSPEQKRYLDQYYESLLTR